MLAQKTFNKGTVYLPVGTLESYFLEKSDHSRKKGRSALLEIRFVNKFPNLNGFLCPRTFSMYKNISIHILLSVGTRMEL